MSKGKLIKVCGECANYDWKKHRCKLGCNEGEPQEPFYTDCPLPTVDTDQVCKPTEWISVDERLPDCEYGSETEALLFRLKTGSVEAGYFGTGGRFRDKYFRCYHHANEGWDAKDVTHWMPLPEPPKGE